MSYNAVYGLIPYSSQPHLQFLPLVQASQICCLLQSYQVYTFACVPPAWNTLSSHTYIALSFLSFRSFPWDYLSEDFSWPLFKIPESSSLELFLASFFALFFLLCTYHYATFFFLLYLVFCLCSTILSSVRVGIFACFAYCCIPRTYKVPRMLDTQTKQKKYLFNEWILVEWIVSLSFSA